MIWMRTIFVGQTLTSSSLMETNKYLHLRRNSILILLLRQIRPTSDERFYWFHFDLILLLEISLDFDCLDASVGHKASFLLIKN